MTALETTPAPLAFDTPPGIAPRGTVLVVPGRGEAPEPYRRLGARLAADTYVVQVVTDPVVHPAASRGQLVAALAAGDVARPVVLLGSDTGAIFAAAQLADQSPPQGPGPGVRRSSRWRRPGPGRRLGRRAGAAHQLPDPPRLPHRRRSRPAAVGGPVPADWPGVDIPAGDVPVLGLHGELDQVSPLAADRPRNAGAELATVREARHGVLNDQSHRSVAATAVLFLERLRAGEPIVDVEAPRG